eukprot:359692-Chlamydomonas_euryale.AAC.9
MHAPCPHPHAPNLHVTCPLSHAPCPPTHAPCPYLHPDAHSHAQPLARSHVCAYAYAPVHAGHAQAPCLCCMPAARPTHDHWQLKLAPCPLAPHTCE